MVSHEEFVKAFQNYVKSPLSESETKLMLQVLGAWPFETCPVRAECALWLCVCRVRVRVWCGWVRWLARIRPKSSLSTCR